MVSPAPSSPTTPTPLPSPDQHLATDTMSIDPHEKIRLTRNRYPTVKDLKLAVLKGEYHQDIAYFSRSFLWKIVCSNSYNVNFAEDELQPIPEHHTISKTSKKTSTKLEAATTDPLSADADTPTDSQDILDVINMDVDRLLISPIFQQENTKQDIIQILYNYHNFTPYKQGYHEICGLVYLQLHNDDPTNANIKMETFNIFTSIMLSVVPNFYNEDNLIGWCTSVFNKYLRLIDPSLYELLIKKHNIESQIWLIRWVRMVFLRELGMDNTLKFLDFLLCYDHDLCKLFPYIIIILLIKIKIQLAGCDDNGEVLSLLLHYPHKELTMDEVKEICDYAIKLYNLPEDKLAKAGQSLNKKFHKSDKIMDLDRLRMELKLQRRVRGALKRK